MSCRKPSPSRLFPESYKPWLDGVFNASRGYPEGLDEGDATCSACAMVAPSGRTRDPGPFRPDLKCCTFFPFLANFSIGAIVEERADFLTSEGGAGFCLPLGLFASPLWSARAERWGPGAFGQSEELLCPYFHRQSRRCGIWEYRSGVCSSYFCKSQFGDLGFGFWNEMQTYLALFEWTLAHEALWRMGFTQDEIRAMESVRENPRATPAEIENAWLEFGSHKNDFFMECRRKARQVSPEEVLELLGDTGRDIEKNLKRSLKSMFRPDAGKGPMIGSRVYESSDATTREIS